MSSPILFKSYFLEEELRHLVNKHDNLLNTIFNFEGQALKLHFVIQNWVDFSELGDSVLCEGGKDILMNI